MWAIRGIVKPRTVDTMAVYDEVALSATGPGASAIILKARR